MKSSKRLTISDTDKATLEKIARNGNTPQKVVLRARIAMMSGEGLPTSHIMQELGTSTPTITRWRTRYEAAGVAGLLRDRTRPGRKKRIDQARVREVVERTLNEKGTLRQQIAVEDVRRTVSFFGSTAGEGGWRIAIVDAVDELNRSSANALLKVLEEPPQRALLLLVSHSAARVRRNLWE